MGLPVTQEVPRVVSLLRLRMLILSLDQGSALLARAVIENHTLVQVAQGAQHA